MPKIAIVNDTAGRGHYGCDLVMSEIERHMGAHDLTREWSHPVGVDWRPIADDLVARPPVDAVIVNGEGSIHHSVTRHRAVYLAEFARFARERLKAPAFLINSTITEIDDHVANCLRDYQAIYVRDSGTQTEMAGYGIESEVVPDLTISAELPPSVGSRAGVCVIDSVVKEAKQALINRAQSETWRYRSMQERLKESGPVDVKAFAHDLASHDMVITGRYHTVTMCIATHTPFVAVESNTPKISWLLDDVFGSRRRMIHLDHIQSFGTSTFYEWTPEEAKSIDHFLQAARSRVSAMFAAITEAADRS